MSDPVALPERIEHHARLVLDASRRRQLAQLAVRTRHQLDDLTISTDDAFATLVEGKNQLQANSIKRPARRFRDILPEVIEELSVQRKGGEVPGIPSGIMDLDDATKGGIRPGELWVAGGLPGRGKTSHLPSVYLGHSVRKACMGSTDAARRAGTKQAISVMTQSRMATITNVSQSAVPTP